MPYIKPLSALRNEADKISKLASKIQEPIFITRKGQGDMVVMSLVLYSKLKKDLLLYEKLAEAQSKKSAGDHGRLLLDVMKDIRKMIHEEKND